MSTKKPESNKNLACPWCETSIEQHLPNTCFNAWVALLLGEKIVSLSSGEKRLCRLETGEYGILEFQDSHALPANLFLEIEDNSIPADHASDQTLNHPCISEIPEYSGTMSFDYAWGRLIDHVSTLNAEARKFFVSTLEEEIREKYGRDLHPEEFLWLYRPFLICKAFIRTIHYLEEHLKKDSNCSGDNKIFA